ncbi:MAG: DUF4097 family beta strand repeat protein [Candidatus Latescibacteria bacterium]|nr:DUF4097 family beta strand repeat protein [Candidatus Latescibacterota bacterium]NIM21725.1 DUF4097 family beta strand repeat protein [Candidatus Latescibacterota bacterium]NIM65863.1 DUF4097 family beta strand repeat protein [Candidatus Latescibacterota bacterium]NIO02608.1 DUF4097 family beta strand repeat protein [Candidatus Latescibacterota bacterium]NIO29589.1 DUF4097 family beta strand repeat protein [Candidatus Latescibacterota bacterium]
MRNLVHACLILILLGFVALPAEAKEISKDIHKSFDVSKGSRLRLKHGDGDVTIQPWDKDVIDVSVRYRASYKSLGFGGDRDFDVLFRQKGDLIEVIGKETSSGFAGILYFNTKEYTYKIQAPSYVMLLLEGDDGDVEITGWEGDIECDLDDGDVSFGNISSADTHLRLEDGSINIEEHSGKLTIEGEDGDVTIIESTLSPCRIHLEDGDIIVKRCEGDFEIGVEDGDMELIGMKLGKLDIESEDGEVDVELAEAKLIDLDIRTEDGDIKVYLPHGISAAFTVDVDDGSIEIELPSAKVLEKKRKWISGEIRDAKGHIRIRTSDGDVILKETK